MKMGIKNLIKHPNGFTVIELEDKDERVEIKPEDKVLVAVYGTLLAGERNAHWANGAKRTPATIKGDLYDTGCGFPAFLPETEAHEDADNLVYAELIETDEKGLAHMDVLEGFPRLYRRERICVYTGYDPVMAWVYVMNRIPTDAAKITTGDWRKHRIAKDKARSGGNKM